jgi:hypothetical protein
MIAANLFCAFLTLAVPEGGSGWMYLLLASAACSVAFAWSARSRARRDDPR